MEQGRGATGSPRVCLWDALANRLGWTPRLPGLVPRGGPWAGEKGRVNVAPHPCRGLSGLLAHLAPRRRLQAVPAPTHLVHAAESRHAERAPHSPAPPARGHPFLEPRRALPCLQTQPTRLSTAFLACPASLLPARAPPALCTGRGRAEMRFPSLAPRCPGSPAPDTAAVLASGAALATLPSLGVCVCLSVVSLPRRASVLFTARSHNSQPAGLGR